MTRHPAPRSRFRRPLSCWLFSASLFLFSTLLQVLSAQVKEPARSFDLPAEPGDKSLARFAAQSGAEVVFGSATAAQVRTNAVKGNYPPREALARLLAGTGLVASTDAKTGAITVTRDPNDSRAAPSARSDRPVNPGASDEAVMISPFEVRTERDTGFAAASSLAGGRLALDLRDTPVAYSVVTRDFIDALGLRDLQSAADWTTSSTDKLDNGTTSLVFNNPVYYTTRGVVSGRQQRNFFPQFNDGDSYNIERYDFGRGPNAILFGNGTLGGVSSSTTKRAQTGQAFQTVQTSIGSWRNYRATLDVNQPLGDKAAVRAATVWGDGDGWMMKDFDKRKAAFLTGTMRPFHATEIRVEGEYGENARQAGFTTIGDKFSGWDGRTVYATPAALRTLPANANNLGINRRGANYYVYEPFSGQNAVMNYQNDPITVAGGTTPTTPIGGFTYGNNAQFITNTGYLLYDEHAPANRFDTVIANSKFRLPSEEFTLSPDAPLLAQRFKDLQFTLNQRAGDFYFELAGDLNRARSVINAEQNSGGNSTYIDINSVLPNGAPNTHYLQPYGDSNLVRSFRRIDYNNLRAAVAWTRGTRFGHLTVNLLGGINQNESATDTRYVSLADGADHRQWGWLSNNVQSIRIRRYWNETSRPIPEFGGAAIRYVDPNTGVARDIRPFWAVDTARRDTQSVNTSNFKYVLASLNAKFWSDRLVVLGAVRRDAYYFVSRQQIDKGDYPLDWNGLSRILRPDAPADYAALTFTPKNAAGAAIGPAQEAATRPRLAATGDPDPLYLRDRFKDDFNAPAVEGGQTTKSVGAVAHLASWFNPSINHAETFNPPTGIQRIDGTLLQPTIASGTDYGLRLELLQSRLNLNFTYYENKEVNNVIQSDGPAFFNTLYDANAIGDQSAGGRNLRGVGALPKQYRDTRTTLGHGFEIELVANLTRAFRLTANVAFPKFYESSLNPDVSAYIAKNTALFKQIAGDAGVLVSAANVATVDTTVPINQRSPDAQAAADAYNNIYNFQANIVGGRRLVQDQPIVNVFADYTIPEGWLKRLRVGAGVRYRGKQILGYRGGDTIVDPRNAANAIDDPSVDAYTPVYAPEGFYNVTATLAYSWRFKRGRELVANLVVNNLLNDRGPVFLANQNASVQLRPLNDDFRSPARVAVERQYSLKQPISYNFTLTLKL